MNDVTESGTSVKSLPFNDEEIPECRVIERVDGKLVQCLEPELECQYCHHFGNILFCYHPMKFEIAKRARKKAVDNG